MQHIASEDRRRQQQGERWWQRARQQQGQRARRSGGPAAPAAAVSVADHVALINAPKVIFTTNKLVFKDEDSDVRLAFQRLNKSIEPLMVSGKDAFWQSAYSLTRPRAAQIAKLTDEFVDANRQPVGTSLHQHVDVARGRER